MPVARLASHVDSVCGSVTSNLVDGASLLCRQELITGERGSQLYFDVVNQW
jgi:hypothetical protein